MRQPTQPIIEDASGVVRFHRNAIVEYLLDHGGIDLNAIAMLDVPRADRIQFAQLIGYSVSGWGDLSYVTDDDFCAVEVLRSNPDMRDLEARATVAEEKLQVLREALREPIAQFYGICPDDLLEMDE